MDDLVGVQMSQAAQDLAADVGYPFLLEALSLGGCKENQENKFPSDYAIPSAAVTDGSDT